RVRQVHHGVGAVERLWQALPAEQVHTGRRRVRHRRVPAGFQDLDHLRSDEPGPADNCDLHVPVSFQVRMSCVAHALRPGTRADCDTSRALPLSHAAWLSGLSWRRTTDPQEPGGKMSIPADDKASLHDLELDVRMELVLAETSEAEPEGDG